MTSFQLCVKAQILCLPPQRLGGQILHWEKTLKISQLFAKIHLLYLMALAHILIMSLIFSFFQKPNCLLLWSSSTAHKAAPRFRLVPNPVQRVQIGLALLLVWEL